MTECQQMLVDRYKKDGPVSERDRVDLLTVGLGAKEFGFEKEIIEYLQTHPYATPQELFAFAEPFFPELVMEDD